jgi:hypothetical protein
MEDSKIKQLFDSKQQRRLELAGLPIEEKLLAVIRLQEMAEPILHKRGIIRKSWDFNQLRHA